jgi:alanyl-tRNA synthetase
MNTVNDIRSAFIDYYVGQGHRHVASSPLVPQNDPTLMFTAAGMVQFKDIFTGREKRAYTRATTAQKCLRAGGKHNDLDNVGYTARHLTFFEMMGNFSFGDYFKSDAIPFAWEMVTKTFGLDKSKLLVTVYHTDEEAASLWKKVAGFSDDRIIRIKTNDNFWMMGDTGPCGPCSEIFYDKGEHIAGGPPGSPDEDGDRFLEFYNLVFMQYEQEPDGKGGHKRVPLPKPSIDTGLGLERMATLLQGTDSVFEIDLFRTIIKHVEELVKVKENPSHRVIADHLRASAFMLADGVMPSNEGRGYVLRRIMRRGMRHAHLLGSQEPLMYRLVPTLIALMGDAYPELKRAQALITETLKNEEHRFKKTLDRGLKLLDEETATLSEGHALSGETAFRLYDTYGFPVDLTADALRAKGMSVDMPGFETAMAKQKQTARASWSGTGDATNEKLWFDLLDEVGPTEFLGYDTERVEGQITAIVKDTTRHPGERRDLPGNKAEDPGICRDDELRIGEVGLVITNQTPFYAESGGQVGDTGTITGPNGKGEVADTLKKAGKIFAHLVKITEGTFKTGEGVELKVDHIRRSNIRAHHSVTHLLHEALRRTLGDHVAQKGSLQTAERTRFDFAQPVAITPEQLKTIEADVNREILANSLVQTRVMGIEDAMETGARALFGEKYGDEVRVVSMGTKEDGANKVYSVELCGGTHVGNTGEIGLFKIVAESAVSSGVRRVEGLAGTAALAWLNEQEQRLRQAADLLKTTPGQLPERIQSLQEQNRKLENELSALRRQMATGGGPSADVKDIAGTKFAGKVLANVPAKDLKPMVDDFKKKLGSGVVALIATEDGKASIVVGVTDDLTSRYSAVELVKTGVAILGGKGGGGRADMAQGGGPNAEAANDAVSAIESALAS